MRAARTQREELADEATKRLGGKPRAYSVKCRRCGHVEHLSAYPVAQLSSGHDLTWRCPCGASRDIKATSFKQGRP